MTVKDISMITSPSNNILTKVCTHNELVSMSGNEGGRVKALVTKFVSSMYPSFEHYVAERAADKNAVALQVFNGKLAEFFALKFAVQKLNFPKCEIDLEIREGSKKGWVVDFPFNSMDKNLPNGHCKNCTPFAKNMAGEYSWSFQFKNNSNGYGRDPLFDCPDSMDLVFGTYVIDSYNAIVLVTAPWKVMVDNNILRPPIKEDKKEIKKCIYYSDLLRLAGDKNG
jgi:hypothetical protein